MELRDKRPVSDKRTEQTSGRWHMRFTLADWWKHGLFNTPHLSLLHISPSALCQSQRCTLVIFSCLEWIIVFVCFERCERKVYCLCIPPWFVDPNALNSKKYDDTSRGRTTLRGTPRQIHLCIPAIDMSRSLFIQYECLKLISNGYFSFCETRKSALFRSDCIASDDKLWTPTISLIKAYSMITIQKEPWHFLH